MKHYVNCFRKVGQQKVRRVSLRRSDRDPKGVDLSGSGKWLSSLPARNFCVEELSAGGTIGRTSL